MMFPRTIVMLFLFVCGGVCYLPAQFGNILTREFQRGHGGSKQAGFIF